MLSWDKLAGGKEGMPESYIYMARPVANKHSQTYCPLSTNHLVAAVVMYGNAKLVLIDLENMSWTQLAETTTISDTAFDAITRVSDSRALVIGSGTTVSQTLYEIRIDGESRTRLNIIRKSSDEDFDQSMYSRPETIHIKSKGNPSRDIYGFLWMPHNPRFCAPEGTLPPLIISVHGGPTGHVGSGLKARTQYFTTRGYAIFCANYTGSTGYGGQYRDSLFGYWGVTDSDDISECAEFFVAEGRVNPQAIGITGPSAGGYNVLQSMIRHPKTFASGLCVSGVSDVKKLGEDTHKLEMKYIRALTIPKDTPQNQIDAVYHERSPIYHASNIEHPLMLIHGTDDTVVPIEQARSIARAIGGRGGVVKLLELKGEGHTLRGSTRVWLEEEEKWWQSTLFK